HAWAVADWSELKTYCDNLAREDIELSWGPLRHGPGFNLATYILDPDGVMIEVYTELLQITDERSYVPIDWSEQPRVITLWCSPVDATSRTPRASRGMRTASSSDSAASPSSSTTRASIRWPRSRTPTGRCGVASWKSTSTRSSNSPRPSCRAWGRPAGGASW